MHGLANFKNERQDVRRLVPGERRDFFYNYYRVKTRSGIQLVSYQKFTWSLLRRSEVADGWSGPCTCTYYQRQEWTELCLCFPIRFRSAVPNWMVGEFYMILYFWRCKNFFFGFFMITGSRHFKFEMSYHWCQTVFVSESLSYNCGNFLVCFVMIFRKLLFHLSKERVQISVSR